LPLSEKARIEIYIRDLPDETYQGLLAELERELTYAFGGCSVIEGVRGNYLTTAGPAVPDRITLLYTDTPLALSTRYELASAYAGELRDAAFRALREETVLVAVTAVHHAV